MDNLSIADLLPLISKLSENPAAMSAISGLMGAMNGSKSEPPKEKQTDDPLASIMTMMGGERKTDEAPKASHGASGITSFSKMLGSKEEIKNRILLLNALRPYLSEARREKLETVIKLMRLAEIGTLGSLLK